MSKKEVLEFVKGFNLKSDGKFCNQISLFGKYFDLEANKEVEVVLESFYFKRIDSKKDENELLNFLSNWETYYYKDYKLEKHQLGFYMYMIPFVFKDLWLNEKGDFYVFSSEFKKIMSFKTSERMNLYARYAALRYEDFIDKSLFNSVSNYMVLSSDVGADIYIVKSDDLKDKGVIGDRTLLKVPLPWVNYYGGVVICSKY